MQINDTIFNASLEEIFEELRSQLHIKGSTLFEKDYKNTETHIQVQCPFHGGGQERKPSAGIRKSDGVFHCFACNKVHSLPELVSYCFGYNDILGKQGWKWLVKNFATVTVEERKDIELDYGRDKKSTVQKVQYISEKELDTYRYYHKYWETRGIVDKELFEIFDLGYDANTQCITMPVRDENGNCVFVARRSVNTKWFNYPKGVEKPLYGLYEILQNSEYWSVQTTDGEIHEGWMPSEIFICESMIDCILLWQAGFHAVALNGTGNELQFKQLRQLSCRKYILTTDNDDAGMEARQRIKKNVPNKLFTEIIFPSGIKDVGDLGKVGKFETIKNIKKWEVF